MSSADQESFDHWITEYSGMTESKIRGMMSGWKQHTPGWAAGETVLQRRRDHALANRATNSPLLISRAVDFYTSPLNADTFVLLDYIWNQFREANTWPTTWMTHRELEKQFVANAKKDLNHAFLIENPSTAGQIYELQILGVLLTSKGRQFQELLERYVVYLREVYPTASENHPIPASEVQEALELHPSETKLLGSLVERLGLGSYAKLHDGSWTAYLSRDIEDFIPEITPGDFLKLFLNRRYSHLRSGSPTAELQLLSFEPNDFLTPKAIFSADAKFENVDHMIVKALREKVPLAAASYEQALRDLADEKRASYRGPAADMRESLRETLDYFAPDDAVTKIEGYKQEPHHSGPTMRQKVLYVLKKRGQQKDLIATVESATTMIEEIVGAFVRSVYTRSNISAHGATDRKEVLRLRQYVRIALMEIMEIHA